MGNEDDLENQQLADIAKLKKALGPAPQYDQLSPHLGNMTLNPPYPAPWQQHGYDPNVMPQWARIEPLQHWDQANNQWITATAGTMEQMRLQQEQVEASRAAAVKQKRIYDSAATIIGLMLQSKDSHGLSVDEIAGKAKDCAEALDALMGGK